MSLPVVQPEQNGPAIDVGDFIDGQKIRWFTTRLILLSALIILFDGFDMGVIAYVAPYINEQFGLGRVQMGTLFSIGVFGSVIGGFAFGYLGDRIGRRPTILFSAACFAILTLVFAAAPSYEWMLAIRFFGGIALGGLIPVCWTLNIEYVPRAYRATVVTIVMAGYSAGLGIAGPISILLAPTHGWQSVYIAGGIGTAVVTLLLFWRLPESVRFLAGKGCKPEVIARNLRALAPQTPLAANARFVSDDRTKAAAEKFRFASLFQGELRWITPLVWIGFMASCTANGFQAAWIPTVLEDIGYTRANAAAFQSMASIGGTSAGLLLMRFTDIKGPASIAIVAVLSIPILLYMGLAKTGFWGFLLLGFLVASTLGGAQQGISSIAGVFYPSSIRANGAGWAISVGKIGSIIGPMIGGLILATSFPVKGIFALLAVCPAVLALATLAVHRIARRQYLPASASTGPT